MARICWFDLNDEIFRLGLSRLSQMTNESIEPVRVGLFVSGTLVYDLPFYGCRDLTMFYDDQQQGAGVAALMRGTGADGQDQVLLNAPPGPSGVMLSAQTASGVLASQLLRAILDGQGLVTDALWARGYTRYATDATDVPVTLLGWAWAIAEWKLTMGLKRAPLGDAFRTIDIAYKEVVGGVDIEGHRHAGQLTGLGTKDGLAQFAPNVSLGDVSGCILADTRIFKEKLA